MEKKIDIEKTLDRAFNQLQSGDKPEVTINLLYALLKQFQARNSPLEGLHAKTTGLYIEALIQNDSDTTQTYLNARHLIALNGAKNQWLVSAFFHATNQHIQMLPKEQADAFLNSEIRTTKAPRIKKALSFLYHLRNENEATTQELELG